MRVRVLQSFDAYRRGQEFDWPAPMVKIMRARGLVEPIGSEPEDRADVVEAAVMPEQRTERAAAPRKPRRRKA